MYGFLGLLGLTLILSGWVGYKLADLLDKHSKKDNFLP